MIDIINGPIDQSFFPYPVQLPWTHFTDSEFHPDWIPPITTVTDWLETSIGRETDTWIWTRARIWVCSIKFKHGRDRTLFLLRWGYK